MDSLDNITQSESVPIDNKVKTSVLAYEDSLRYLIYDGYEKNGVKSQ